MQYLNVGRSGLRVSRIALGCMTYGLPASRPWMLDAEAAKPFFRRAFELGITLFDTAKVYSAGVSEEITGRWVKEFGNRHDVVIATKVGIATGEGPNNEGLSRKHILDQVHLSLRRLGTDYIDLYQIHRFDYGTPIEETLETLDGLVRAGKVRYLGASSMFAWQLCKMLCKAERQGWSRFVSIQAQCNLVYREEEREVIPLCRAEGLGVLPWSPLARGFLLGDRPAPLQGPTVRARTDERSPRLLYFRDADFRVVEALGGVAAARGVGNAQIALAWLLGKPGIVAPIVGATQLHHLDDAVAALDLHLEPAEVEALETPYQSKPVLDHA